MRRPSVYTVFGLTYRLVIVLRMEALTLVLLSVSLHADLIPPSVCLSALPAGPALPAGRRVL